MSTAQVWRAQHRGLLQFFANQDQWCYTFV